MSNTSHRLIKYSADLHSYNSIDPSTKTVFVAGENVVFCADKNYLISLRSLKANDYVCPFCLKKLNSDLAIVGVSQDIKKLRQLRVFLCHASADKPAVRELYKRLKVEGWIDPWLDEENLTLGQHWTTVIEEALDIADVVIVFLSNNSIRKEGFVQRELNYAWDISLEKPRNVIFLIPFRLDECEVPRHLRSRHWGDYFGEKKETTYKTLMRSLKERHQQKLLLEAEDDTPQEEDQETELKRLESQAIQYELIGDLWNARKTWYEIKRIDPLFHRVDMKIRELELEAAEKAAREKEKREATEKAKREWAERRAAQIATLKETLSKSSNALKSALLNAKPFFRIVGIIGVIIFLFWVGSWGIPKLASLVPTAKASLTPTLRPSATVTFTLSPAMPMETLTPKPTSTKTLIPTNTFTATPLSAEITDTKGVPMVLVPVGEFTMGRSSADARVECQKFQGWLPAWGPDTACGLFVFVDEEPPHKIYLDAFYMDKYEVTNADYKNCVDIGACQPPTDFSSTRASSGGDYGVIRPSYYGNSQYSDYPIIHVNWFMAKTYCEWRGAQLPTEAQWEKAALGTEGNVYPWGNSSPNSSMLNFRSTMSSITSKVGSYTIDLSPYYLYDMAGNVREWVFDWYGVDYYHNSPSSNPLGPSTGSTRVIRGASISYPRYSIASAIRRYADPNSESYDLGFRCARNANP